MADVNRCRLRVVLFLTWGREQQAGRAARQVGVSGHTLLLCWLYPWLLHKAGRAQHGCMSTRVSDAAMAAYSCCFCCLVCCHHILQRRFAGCLLLDCIQLALELCGRRQDIRSEGSRQDGTGTATRTAWLDSPRCVLQRTLGPSGRRRAVSCHSRPQSPAGSSTHTRTPSAGRSAPRGAWHATASWMEAGTTHLC